MTEPNPLEQQLRTIAAHPQMLEGTAGGTLAGRLDENLLAIHAELDAPREPRLARLLRRLGVSDLTIPLVTATPALRRSWFISVILAVLFALSVASNDNGVGADRIAVFLTLAPLLPLFGVALAFGKGVDPTHDLVVAAPRDTFVVFLVRAITVLIASSSILLVASALLPEGGAYRFAWLLPAVAITAAALALSERYHARRVAIGLGIAWVLAVLVATSASSVAAMFGAPTQLASIVVGLLAGVWMVLRRRGFDPAAAGS